MYKLYIEDLNGVWKMADMGDDKPAMNYQANNIAELKDRQANYSQALKLPMTKNNCQILSNTDSFDVVTSIPYKNIKCRLFSNDSVLAGPGSILIIDKVTTDFEVEIISGNADLFETLTNNKMLGLDLGSYILASKMKRDNYADENYCLALATFYGGSDEVDLNSTNCIPFAYLKNAIEKIISTNGYTLDTNLLNADWNEKAINICTFNPTSGSFIPMRAYTNNTYTKATADHYNYVNFALTPNGNGRAVNYVDAGYDPVYPYRSIRYTPTFDCIITIKFHIQTSGFGNGASLRIAKVDSEGVVIGLPYYNADVYNNTIDLSINMTEGDILDLSLMKLAGTVDVMGMMTTTIEWLTVADDLHAGCSLDVASNLGFETQFDFFKIFVQLYGLTVSVDNVNNIVYAYTMQKLYDNKIIAKDWSNKLNDVPGETYFKLGDYVQKNVISFNENSVDSVNDSGSFLVDNETLDKTKDLFTINLEAGKDRNLSGHPIANIPIETMSDNVITLSGGKPHIVDIYQCSITDQQTFILNTTIHVKVILNTAIHVKVQYFIDTFYLQLTTMLTGLKYNESYYYLTDKDIEDFDQYTPVYIQKFGHYFYVNKIVNYTSGVLTKCQLIKL